MNFVNSIQEIEPQLLRKNAMDRRRRRYRAAYIKKTLSKCYNPPPTRSQSLAQSAKKEGFRPFFLTNGTLMYRGWWKDDMRHGFGTQINSATKEVYEGGFVNDKSCGYGVSSQMNQNGARRLIYDGEFSGGEPHGNGELYSLRYHYKGQVVHGKATGMGMAWFQDGSFYSGAWLEGKRMGQGILVCANKNRYEGKWCNDMKHGLGQFYFLDIGQALEGVWVKNICITATVRNIKYRQAAINPVKYAIPKLMLKDWSTCYKEWVENAIAKAHCDVEKDMGIEEEKESARTKYLRK